MASLLFNTYLAIPLDEEGKLPPVFYQKLNEALHPTQLQALSYMTVLDVTKKMIQWLKQYSVKVNEGQYNEEMTVKATYHIHRHDEGLPCDQEEEI